MPIRSIPPRSAERRPRGRSRILLLAIVVLLVAAAAIPLATRRPPDTTATLAVASNPPGATLTVDGIYQGVTPVTTKPLAPGEHSIKLVKYGFAPCSKAVTLEAGQQELSMDLTPEEKFKLLVVSDPPRSTVFLDGAELAERTPVEIPALDPGRHEIGIRAEGYLPFAQEVEVGPGQPAKIEAKLQSKMESYYLGSIREDPDTISNYTELAHHYVIVNKFGEAAAALTKALELACDKAADASHVARLHQEIRSIYYGSFDFGGAAALAEVRPMIERLLREAIRDRPAASAPYCLLSAIYMASGKLEKAEDVLRDGAQNARDKASLLLALAQVLYRQAKYEQAAVCLDQLLKEQERNVAARNLLAQVYQRLGKTDLAVQHRKLVADLGKSNPAAAIGALSCLAGFYQRKGDHARAAETWEKAASLQKDAALGAQYRMAAAGEYAQARKWDRAIALCQEVIQTTPDEALKSQATQQLEKARKRKR